MCSCLNRAACNLSHEHRILYGLLAFYISNCCKNERNSVRSTSYNFFVNEKYTVVYVNTLSNVSSTCVAKKKRLSVTRNHFKSQKKKKQK